MTKLSTGQDSTLKNWRALVKAAFGNGPALKFIDNKIKSSPNGEQEEIIADESQFLYVLGQMQFK